MPRSDASFCPDIKKDWSKVQCNSNNENYDEDRRALHPEKGTKPFATPEYAKAYHNYARAQIKTEMARDAYTAATREATNEPRPEAPY